MQGQYSGDINSSALERVDRRFRRAAGAARLLAGRLRRRDLHLRLGPVLRLDGQLTSSAPSSASCRRPTRRLLADASDGGVFAFGDTGFYGSIPGLGLHPAGSGLPNSLNAPIVGMVPSTDDGGYFMVASDGGVFAFGDAQFAGSVPGHRRLFGCRGGGHARRQRQRLLAGDRDRQRLHLRRRPVLRAPGPHGSPSPRRCPRPTARATGSCSANGAGLRLRRRRPTSAVAAGADSAASTRPPPSSPPPTAAGYWVAVGHGAVYNFGDAPNDGGMAGTHLNGSIIAATGF